jgi:hypothetical protein
MRLANGGGGANHRRLDLRCSPAQVVPGVDLVEGGALARVKKGSKRITKNSSKINSKLNLSRGKKILGAPTISNKLCLTN